MEWLYIFISRLRAFVRREAVTEDYEEEMRLHIEMETEANLERGMSPPEARAAARKSFGNPGRMGDLAYEIRIGGWIDTLWQDIDRKSTRLNSSHLGISYAVFCLKQK